MPTKAMKTARESKRRGVTRRGSFTRRTRTVGTQTDNSSSIRIGGGAATSTRLVKTGFPPTMNLKLRYQSDTITLTCTSGVAQFYQFNLNGLFDPNLTGTGHQPLGYDSVKLLYNRYRVDRASYELNFVNTSSVLPINFSYGYNPSTSGPVSGTQTEAKNWFKGTGGANNTAISIKGKTSLWKAASVTKARWKTDDIYTATISANPGTTPTLQIYVEPYDQSTTTTIKIAFNMIYHAHFYEPIYLATS